MSNPSFSLAGRKALVTGASRGIGQALAIGLAQAGADVAVAARELPSLAATEAAIAVAGRSRSPSMCAMPATSGRGSSGRVFLCSDAAAYITGRCLHIDGGYLASI